MIQRTLLNANSVINMALGIAFILYAPLMLRVFGIPEIPSEDVLLYWNVASFARLFGAAMFGIGLLIFSLRTLSDNSDTHQTWRGIYLAQLFTYIILAITTVTQQVSAWQSAAGWLLGVYFLALIIGYGYLLLRKQPG